MVQMNFTDKSLIIKNYWDICTSVNIYLIKNSNRTKGHTDHYVLKIKVIILFNNAWLVGEWCINGVRCRSGFRFVHNFSYGACSGRAAFLLVWQIVMFSNTFYVLRTHNKTRVTTESWTVSNFVFGSLFLYEDRTFKKQYDINNSWLSQVLRNFTFRKIRTFETRINNCNNCLRK